MKSAWNMGTLHEITYVTVQNGTATDSQISIGYTMEVIVFFCQYLSIDISAAKF